MPFRVFLSYSLHPAEQSIAWRLQTLAAAYGIEMYVPRYESNASLLPGATSVQAAIDKSDCVLAIFASPPGPVVRKEIEYALKARKPVIPIVQQGLEVAKDFRTVFVFNSWDTAGKVESKVIDYLKSLQLSKDKQQAIASVAAIGIGLLLLSSLNK